MPPTTGTPTKKNISQFLPVEAVLPAPAARRGLGQRQALALDARHSASTAAFSPPAKSPALKAGRDGAVDDLPRRQVGHRAFQRLGHLDAHAPVVLRDHDEHAVADLAPADLPAVGHALRVGGDVLGLRARHHQHHDLRPRGLLEGGQLGVQRAALRRVERAGLVDDAAVSAGTGSTSCAQAAPGRPTARRPAAAAAVQSAQRASSAAHHFDAQRPVPRACRS